MRKLLASLALMAVTCAGVQAGVKDKLLLYIPNRIIDAADIFSLSLGFGPAAKLELRGTRAFAGGGGIGPVAAAIKDYNRQYGGGLENGWDWAFTCVGAEDMERTHTNRWVQEYWHTYSGMPSPSDNIYNFHEGARDYWEFGGEAALLIYGRVAIHPVEVADFITGFVFIDLKDDDLTSESF